MSFEPTRQPLSRDEMDFLVRRFGDPHEQNHSMAERFDISDAVKQLTAKVSELREALKNQICAWPVTSKDHPAYRLAYLDTAPGIQKHSSGECNCGGMQDGDHTVDCTYDYTPAGNTQPTSISINDIGFTEKAAERIREAATLSGREVHTFVIDAILKEAGLTIATVDSREK